MLFHRPIDLKLQIMIYGTIRHDLISIANQLHTHDSNNNNIGLHFYGCCHPCFILFDSWKSFRGRILFLAPLLKGLSGIRDMQINPPLPNQIFTVSTNTLFHIILLDISFRILLLFSIFFTYVFKSNLMSVCVELINFQTDIVLLYCEASYRSRECLGLF